jgi:hypothetical protein
MLKKYSIWLKISAILQLLTALLHSIGFFVQLEPQNETEKQMLTLMDTYKADIWLGFTPTFSNLFLSMSVCFTLLCLFGGCLNFYLLRKKTDLEILKGVILINLVIFGICFVVMAIFTFLPPILSTGLIFVALIITYISLRTTLQTS